MRRTTQSNAIERTMENPCAGGAPKFAEELLLRESQREGAGAWRTLWGRARSGHSLTHGTWRRARSVHRVDRLHVLREAHVRENHAGSSRVAVSRLSDRHDRRVACSDETHEPDVAPDVTARRAQHDARAIRPFGGREKIHAICDLLPHFGRERSSRIVGSLTNHLCTLKERSELSVWGLHEQLRA